MACPPTLATVGEFFQYLLTLAQTKPAVVVFDACTAFDDINPNLWSQMQKAWDLTKNQSALMVVMCDAAVSAMKAVFYEKAQPLFGRPPYALTVKSFTPQGMTSLVLKANPEAKPIDLLTLYAITGGVPGLLEDFVDHGALTAAKALQHVCSPQGAWVRRQGEVFLNHASRVEATRYYEILMAIASGATHWRQIEARIECASQLSPYLRRLETFGLIEKRQPIFEPIDKKNASYRIPDQALWFWFTFIFPLVAKTRIEAHDWSGLRHLVDQRLPAFLEATLKRWMIERYRYSHAWEVVDRWWTKASGREAVQNESHVIDVVAINTTTKTVLLADVMGNAGKEDERRSALEAAAKAFFVRHPAFQTYRTALRSLSLSDLL